MRMWIVPKDRYIYSIIQKERDENNYANYNYERNNYKEKCGWLRSSKRRLCCMMHNLILKKYQDV